MCGCLGLNSKSLECDADIYRGVCLGCQTISFILVWGFYEVQPNYVIFSCSSVLVLQTFLKAHLTKAKLFHRFRVRAICLESHEKADRSEWHVTMVLHSLSAQAYPNCLSGSLRSEGDTLLGSNTVLNQ